jgi:rhamnosyltransferase
MSLAEECLRHVYIVGCKGIPAKYGGFETFVDRLVTLKTSPVLKYHVACFQPTGSSGDSPREFEHHGARCYNVKVMPIGPAKAIVYDIIALHKAMQHAKSHRIERPIFYVLASRIGPMMGHFARRVRRTGGTLMVNPDGHEFLRKKWGPLVRRYWKYSEKLMVKHAGMVVCDSRHIETYIKDEYARACAGTVFIPYGADAARSSLPDDDPVLTDWYASRGLRRGEYYLVVGRFVPENNYEIILREFISSGTKRDLVLITNVDNASLLDALRQRTAFQADSRVKFVGTVYEPELLKKIREGAFAYVHGHEVGGTNPSLLEAQASTDLNLLLDVGFNQEVAEDCALYWGKAAGALSGAISEAEQMEHSLRLDLARRARERIVSCYSWTDVVASYEKLFAAQATDRSLAAHPGG